MEGIGDLPDKSTDLPNTTGATQVMADVSLDSDDENEVTLTDTRSRDQGECPPLSEARISLDSDAENEALKSSTPSLSHGGPSPASTLVGEDQVSSKVDVLPSAGGQALVRQDAVVTAPPQNLDVGRTKEMKAMSGARSSLAYLKKMAKRDPKLFTARERHFVKKHRQNIAKFERNFGSTKDVLGIASNFIQRGEASSTATAVDGKQAEPPKQVPATKVFNLPTKDSRTNKVGESPSCSHHVNRKEVVKRARSGDDQSSTSKKAKKVLGPEILQAAVIDHNDPFGKINSDLWRPIEDRLLDQLADFKGPKEDVSFKGAEWQRG